MKQTKKGNAKVAVYILAFMALTFSIVGGAFLYYSSDFVANAHEVSGTVMDVSVTNNEGTIIYKPTISYMDINGTKQTGQTFLSSSNYNFPRGTKLNILYDPRDPSTVRMNSWFGLWGFPMIFLGIGITLAVIAIIVAFNLKKSKPSAARGESSRQKPAASYSYSSNEGADERQPTIRRR